MAQTATVSQSTPKPPNPPKDTTPEDASTSVPAMKGPNPKDSMVATWRYGDKKSWGLFHWLVYIFGLHPTNFDKKVPIMEKTTKVPYVPHWQIHRWILTHALVPLFVHQAYVYFFDRNFSPTAALLFYSVAFDLIGIHQINILRRLGHRYGFLDGDKHERDGIPDIRVRQVVTSLMATVTFRELMAVLLCYRRDETPLDFVKNNLWAIPIELGIYGIVLDFWFYWYHRVMHQFDGLWKFHRTHHLTKHPNAMLTLYADAEQETFDIVAIPLIACLSLKAMGLPMGFYDWWICGQYVVFAELTGHSGIRVHTTTPSTLSWLLRIFNCELVIEDHDLHHRKGWRKSSNYGKQTRLWDTIFGTCAERIESREENVDYVNKAYWPVFY